MLRSFSARLAGLSLLALFILVIGPATEAPAFATQVKVTLIVRSMEALDDDLESDTDLYVRAGLGLDPSVESSFGQIVVDEDAVDASDPGWANGWSMSRVIPANTELIEVRMQGWDNDNCDNPACEGENELIDPDDKGDVSPEAGQDYSEFFNLYGSDIMDDGFTSKCIQGNESGKIKVCFDLQIFDPGPDADGDGLLDRWETEGQGLDVDRDGTIDLDLYAMGARPDHKDVFLELDWDPGQAPSRESIQAMKKAFAVQNITLWVDTGSLVDPNAREGQTPGTCMDGINNDPATDAAAGQLDQTDPDCIGTAPRRYLETSVEDPQPGNCTDGMDNDGDLKADSQDSDCLVGDNLGGGAQGAGPTNACGTDATFYAVKSFRFDIQRRWVFRYAIASTLPASCLDTTMPPDGVPDIPGWGGQGEIGGNDFIEFNHDGGTIMHEFGHTLNLHHGGDTDANCSPPYVSVMNYDNQGGINRVGGGFILDYAPPRIALDGSSRGVVPQPIQETDLDEDYVMDGTDNANMFVFADEPFGTVPPGTKRTRNMNTAVDWNNDGDNDERGFDSNVNTGTPNPGACQNNIVGSGDLKGHNDWNAIQLNLRKFNDDRDQMLGGEDPNELPPTLEQLNIATNQALDTTPPTVVITASPADPSNNPDATFTFVGTDNEGGTGVASFECRLDGASWDPCTSPHGSGIVAPPDGLHTFDVRAIDGSNNIGNPASYTWLVDVTKPVIAGIVTEYTEDGERMYSVFEQPDRWARNSVTVEFVCVDPANLVASGIASASGLPGRKTLTNDGRYSIAGFLGPKARCTDKAGNTAETGSTALKVNVDRHAPTCDVSPAVQYVPKNVPATSGQTYARSVSPVGQDGNLPAAALTFKLLSVAGPGTITGWDIGSETPTVDTSGRFEGRPGAIYDITYQVRDPAGWTSRCSAKVKTSN